MAQYSENKSILKKYSTAIFVAVIVALLIRYFLYESYQIPSHLMKPSLLEGDYIFAEKWPYRIGNKKSKRGDLVILTPSKQPTTLIKRVIAIAGDTIHIKDGILYLNKKPLPFALKNSEPTENCGIETLPQGKNYPVCYGKKKMANYGPQKIPPGSVFVIGDYREKGASIIEYGVFPEDTIIGSPSLIWLSIDRKAQSNQGGFFNLRWERIFKEIH